MALKETQEKLRQWGVWQRGGSGLGYGNVLGKIRGGGLPSAPISDDHALSIDGVVGTLKKTNYTQYRCIKLSYVDQFSNAVIGRELGFSHTTAQTFIKSAEQWIDDAFAVMKIF